MDCAKLKLFEEYGIYTLKGVESLTGVKYAKPQFTPTPDENVFMTIEKLHQEKNISQESMERDYFKFCKMENKNLSVLKQIIDKYTVEEVEQTIKDLIVLNAKAKNTQSCLSLDPEIFLAIAMIPRYTSVIQCYNKERVDKAKMKNGNIQKDKRFFAVTITTPDKVPILEAENFINKFCKSKTFGKYVYCIEHIHQNIHCHVCLNLDDKVQCLKPKKFLDKFNKFAEKHKIYRWTMQLLDSKGYPHYWAKSWKQCQNFVNYICKYEDDKQIYLEDCLIRQYPLGEISKDFSEDDFKKLSLYINKGCPAEDITENDAD